MEIGISTAGYYSRLCTEEALKELSRQGASICEVFLDTYSEYTPAFGAVLRDAVDACHLRVVSVHAMSQQFEPQLFSLSRRQKEDAWQLFESVLKQGKLLGATRYVMHGAARLRGVLRNAQFSRIAPIMSEIADLAAEYGILLAWENVSWCMFDSPDFVSQVMPYIKSENFRFTLDIKQAVRSGYDPFDYLKAMGDRLCHVHLCDYDLEKPKLGLCMPGKGTFDFKRLGRELRSMGYQGDAILEPYSDIYGGLDDMGAALNWLQEQML